MVSLNIKAMPYILSIGILFAVGLTLYKPELRFSIGLVLLGLALAVLRNYLFGSTRVYREGKLKKAE